MKTYFYPRRAEWKAILARPEPDSAEDLRVLCKTVFDAVRERGDKALREYTLRFDEVAVERLQVSEEEFAAAEKAVEAELKDAVRIAARNIEAFHRTQMPTIIEWENEGIVCCQEPRPIEKVGLYIPGGSAPLFSTVLMLAIPARIAGCREVVLCTPPDSTGSVNPAILWAARFCGVEKVFKIGGVQAVAAMTLGTESVPKVYKIFGPGNRYVTAAKQYATTCGAAIDMPAGPSELMVVADDSADPRFVAADLLSQAEHGPDSQAILVTWSPGMAALVEPELIRQMEDLPRRETAAEALGSSRIVVVRDRAEALAMANEYSPEHLILSVEECDDFAAGVMNAGSVFLGNYTPESAGDYASGTNHTLPTSGWARTYSGVNMDAFLKKITFQRIKREGLESLGPAICTMAQAESLTAHARAVTIRLLDTEIE